MNAASRQGCNNGRLMVRVYYISSRMGRNIAISCLSTGMRRLTAPGRNGIINRLTISELQTFPSPGRGRLGGGCLMINRLTLSASRQSHADFRRKGRRSPQNYQPLALSPVRPLTLSPPRPLTCSPGHPLARSPVHPNGSIDIIFVPY